MHVLGWKDSILKEISFAISKKISLRFFLLILVAYKAKWKERTSKIFRKALKKTRNTEVGGTSLSDIKTY